MDQESSVKCTGENWPELIMKRKMKKLQIWCKLFQTFIHIQVEAKIFYGSNRLCSLPYEHVAKQGESLLSLFNFAVTNSSHDNTSYQ